MNFSVDLYHLNFGSCSLNAINGKKRIIAEQARQIYRDVFCARNCDFIRNTQ